MAEVVSEETQHPAAAAPGADKPFFRQTQREIIAHQRRFGLAYFLLAVGVGVAVGLGIVLVGRGSSHQRAAGASVFRATHTGELGAKEIARHVGQEYRESNGSQLVAVIGERPNYQDQPLQYYLIRPHDAQYPNDVGVFTVGNGIMYSMCGPGKDCAASATTATRAGATMLKREALELSFDTFKSDSSVQTVTTLLPPLSQSTLAIIFKRSDLGRWLSKPLSSILPRSAPIGPGKIPTDEAQRIDTIEAGAIYQYEAAQGPDGNPILRLDPIG